MEAERVKRPLNNANDGQTGEREDQAPSMEPGLPGLRLSWVRFGDFKVTADRFHQLSHRRYRRQTVRYPAFVTALQLLQYLEAFVTVSPIAPKPFREFFCFQPS